MENVIFSTAALNYKRVTATEKEVRVKLKSVLSYHRHKKTPNVSAQKIPENNSPDSSGEENDAKMEAKESDIQCQASDIESEESDDESKKSDGESKASDDDFVDSSDDEGRED